MITVEELKQIPGVDDEKAALLLGLIENRLDPCSVSAKCETWVRSCHHPPSRHERVLEAANEIIEGCGIVALLDDEQHHDGGVRMCPAFSYVNLGDPYIVTFMRAHENGEYIVSSWGDALKTYEKAHKLGDFEEFEEEPERCTSCHGTSMTLESVSFKQNEGDEYTDRYFWVCDSCNHHHNAVDGYEPEVECAECGESFPAKDAWGDGDRDDPNDPNFCSEKCYRTPRQFYSCGICDSMHPATWSGDCRDDNNRYLADELDKRYGSSGWEEVSTPGKTSDVEEEPGDGSGDNDGDIAGTDK